MSDLIIHKTDKLFYQNKNYGDTYLSKIVGTDSRAAFGDLTFIKFRCFDNIPWMDACMTTRLGGVSTGHLAGLNLGDDRGDDPENVYTNYIHIANSLDIPIDNFVKTDQVHDNKVAEALKTHLPAGPKIRRFPKTDGVYTSLSQVPLCIGAADCVPVLFVCTDIKMVCGVHSGWRGTVGGIGTIAVEKMAARGASPECMIALIGPSICQDNYEVTGDVIEKFIEAGFTDSQMKDIACKTDDVHYHLDLWAACWYTLVDAGLLPENIHISGVCTYENPDLLWSHRYTKGLRGNQNALIWKN